MEGVSRLLIWSTARDDEIRAGIKAVPPQPGGSERLLVKALSEMMQETTGEYEDAGSAPTQGHDCRPLVSRIVNAGDNGLALQHKSLRSLLDFSYIRV